MLRSLLRLSAAVAFAAVIAPSIAPAAPGPGLAYDEIVRVLVNATPPPPGNFQSDLAALNASPPAVAATEAPRRRGIGIGALAGAVLGGGGAGTIAGAVAGDAAANAMDNAVQQQLGGTFSALAAGVRGFLQPHLMRYAYWNGWERIDDVAAQTATIRKCDIGQAIKLDLAHKTYRVDDPNAPIATAPAPAAPPRGAPRSAPPPPAAPGTAVAELTSTTKPLGALRIDTTPTDGYDSTTTLAMTQATGSCRNASASIHTVEYVSALSRPAVTSCAILRTPPVPETVNDAVKPPSGGCAPTFAFHRSGPVEPAGKLSLYSLVALSGANGTTPAPAPSGGASGIGFLTERGGIKTLGNADAALFEIPAGFIKSP